MTLSDTMAYRQVIGCLMYNPLLLVEYSDIQAADFDYTAAKVCLFAIKKLYEAGASVLTPLEVDQEIIRSGGAAEQAYKNGNGLDFLKEAYEYAQLSNFSLHYNRLKKNSLLRQLKQAKYDISEFYVEDKDVVNPKQEADMIQHLDEVSLEDILNSVEKKYSEIRNKFLQGGKSRGDPAMGIMKLIDELKTTPSVGPSLEGHIFSSVCRGARKGCFFLKSASTSAGKSRTSIFDACHLCYPKHWSDKANSFVMDVDIYGEICPPRKVLFIVTEMEIEEVQTIMLAYLSGIDEDKIIRGKYDTPMEEHRVRTAAKIIEEYKGYFLIEEISDPNLQNVEATIRKYAIVDDVKYVFHDYIHTTASLVNSFSKNGLREDVVLMLMANQLKQLAKEYGLFIFSATQVNAFGMGDDELTFKDEKSIRGSKAVADKCDIGYVMTTISEKGWNTVAPNLKQAVREGTIPPEMIAERPTHVLDIYKMRRGRYKMIRIWCRIHLGTGKREDLFITNAANQPMKEPLNLFESDTEVPITF